VKLGLLLFLSAFIAFGQEPTPDFAHDVAPIVYANCTPCHHDRGPGPFPLENYDQVKKHARQIAGVTKTRYMPPWPPDAPAGLFADERRLTAAQIRIIQDWVAAGAPLGSMSNLPAAPSYDSGWQLGTPDLVLRANRPLTIPGSGSDVFWNFILNPNLKRTRYVRAIEIQPGPNGAIHHANAIIDRTGYSARLEKQAGAGFPGMDVVVDRSPFDPESHFLFWKPGSLPHSEPEGLSWRLDPGNVLVLNTHIQPSGKTELVQPAIGLYFTDEPPSRFPIVIELEHDGALNIPAGARNFLVADDFTLSVDADVLAVYPHAHYLGKLLEAYATLPDGTRRYLICIPNWDLNWQAVYRYRWPIYLPKGSVISMRFQYDNSATNPRNPNQPPKRVQAGNRAVDEMGHLWLQILPVGASDRRRPIEEALMRHRLENYPNDFTAHLNLGAILLSRLDAQGAVAMLRAAARIDPSRPEAHDMLGSALENTGRLTEGITEHRLALRKDPNYLEAHYNLGLALSRAGEFDEAVRHLQVVLAAFPEIARLHDQLGETLVHAGRSAQAESEFRQALKLDPADHLAYAALSATHPDTASPSSLPR
jgi:tetratricopeptide (TPR) repeat protein